MGKYDGLIIPRSYNDYYNKSQPEELRNGIIQNTLGALDTDKGQPVNSAAVNNALAKYPNCTYYNTVQTQSLNCNNIEDRVCLVTANINEYSSLNYPSKELLFIMTTKNSGGDGFQKAISYNTNKEWNRTLVNGNWGDWYEFATKSDSLRFPNYNQVFFITGETYTAEFDFYINWMTLGTEAYNLSIDGQIVSRTDITSGIALNYFSGFVKKGSVVSSNIGVQYSTCFRLS